MESKCTPAPVSWPAVVEFVDGPSSRILHKATVASDAQLVAIVERLTALAVSAEKTAHRVRNTLVRVRAPGGDVVFRACTIGKMPPAP